ncbi:Spo0E family sporulation regulatory protein-aspartic acid phosphatase [Bacillus sp. N9]
MIELGLSSSFIDERVINISNQLDKLLYKYQMIITKNSSPIKSRTTAFIIISP